MVVHSEAKAYKLYNEYAIQIGFSVQKEKLRYAKNVVRQQDYVCSKEGFPQDSDNLDDKKFKKLQTGTSCEASIRFVVTNGEWKITHFNPTHNHEPAKREERSFLRSNRKITDATLGVIKTFKEAGIRTISAYSYLVEEVGGFENVRFIKQDCYNVVNKQKLINVKAGDAQSLVDHFKQKQAEDPIDGRSRIDYNSFGDVIFSFTWLFETFLESMGNQKPKTIFTDQCQAMKNAIRVVFPNTCHRLEGGLTGTLHALLRDYNLVCNKWLNTLYENRDKWCSVFSHNIFSTRMKASSRSESVNNVFQHMGLTEFVHVYEKASKNMRVEELEEDFRCKQGASSQIVKNCGLLEHALSVYTRTFFKRFELEIASTLGVTHQDVYFDGVSFTYEVIEGGGWKVHVVQFNSSNNVLLVQYILKKWTKDAKKDSLLCDRVKPASANDELSVTSRHNELMRLIYKIFTKSAATTRHTEICKRKVREMIELVENYMKQLNVVRDCDEKENRIVANNVFDDVEKTDCSLNRVTNARLKSKMEKRKRKSLKDVTRSRLPIGSSHAPKGIDSFSKQFFLVDFQPMHPSSVPMDENYNNQV
ncbi:hypothetical protein ACB092_12G140700 [Castanea dentata]